MATSELARDLRRHFRAGLDRVLVPEGFVRRREVASRTSDALAYAEMAFSWLSSKERADVDVMFAFGLPGWASDKGWPYFPLYGQVHSISDLRPALSRVPADADWVQVDADIEADLRVGLHWFNRFSVPTDVIDMVLAGSEVPCTLGHPGVVQRLYAWSLHLGDEARAAGLRDLIMSAYRRPSTALEKLSAVEAEVASLAVVDSSG